MGYMDVNGKKVIPATFEVAGPFKGDFAAVRKKNEKFGLIDRKGNNVLAPDFDHVEMISDSGGQAHKGKELLPFTIIRMANGSPKLVFSLVSDSTHPLVHFTSSPTAEVYLIPFYPDYLGTNDYKTLLDERYRVGRTDYDYPLSIFREWRIVFVAVGKEPIVRKCKPATDQNVEGYAP